jgi:hypothetical protein
MILRKGGGGGGQTARRLAFLLLLLLLPPALLPGSAATLAPRAEVLGAAAARALFGPPNPNLDACAAPILPPRLVLVEPPVQSSSSESSSEESPPFLVRRWWARLQAARSGAFPRTPLHAAAYGAVAPLVQLQGVFAFDDPEAIPRPLLLVVAHRGVVRERIDLVSLDAAIDLGPFLAERLRACRDRDRAAARALCAEDPLAGAGTGQAAPGDAVNSAGVTWYDDGQEEEEEEADALSDEVLAALHQIDMFDAPDVLVLGLFFNAETTLLHQKAFAQAQRVWANAQPIHGDGDDGGGDGEGPRVKFVGVRHAAASAAVLRNLTYADHSADLDHHHPVIVAVKPLDNLNVWMHAADTTSARSITGHIQSTLRMAPSEASELLRYGRFTSQTVWGMDTNTHVFVVVDESPANKKGGVDYAQQQIDAVRAMARRVPASRAAFVLVPRTPENAGIIRHLGFSEPTTAILATGSVGKEAEHQEDAKEGRSFVVADVAIMDRSGSVPKKYRMSADFAVKAPLPSRANKEDTGEEKIRRLSAFGSPGVKAFLAAFFQGTLEPYWRSANGPTAGQDLVDLRGELAKTIVERVAGNTLAALLEEETRLRSGVSFLVGLTAQKWCNACERNVPKLREAAGELLATWPDTLRIITVDVDENEIAHLLTGIELRRQPWQYTLPLVLLSPSSENDSEAGMTVKTAPWRGALGALPIDATSLAAFVRDAMLLGGVE